MTPLTSLISYMIYMGGSIFKKKFPSNIVPPLDRTLHGISFPLTPFDSIIQTTQCYNQSSEARVGRKKPEKTEQNIFIISTIPWNAANVLYACKIYTIQK